MSDGNENPLAKELRRIIEAARKALAEHEREQPRTFTVWIQDADGTGTTFITHIHADISEAAKANALLECATEWGYFQEDGETPDTSDLRVVGVANGDVEIVEWEEGE